MIDKNKFWKDIEADDKMMKKVDRMIEKRERKEFERWERKARKTPYFWRKEKNEWL